MANFDGYYCGDCGYTFKDDEAVSDYEIIGEGIMRGKLYFMVCPKCGSDNLGDAIECDECGNLIPAEEINRDYGNYYYCKIFGSG